MKDVIQHLNILKSHKNETYSVNDGRVKVTGKPSKYFSLTEQAATWADGFQISEDMIVEDVRRFEAAGNCLITMAETARRLRNRFRLSADRVDSVVSSQNPDRDQLRAFGDKGVPLLVTKEFKANGIGQRPPLRRRYRLVEGAVDKMIFEGLWKQGLVFE